MSIKCIALDLDGTALIDDQHLSGRTTTAIQEALKRGIKVVVASGRCFDTLPDSIKLIKGIEYAITSNGAAIYHIPTGSCVHKLSVPEALVPVIIKLTQEAHCAIEVFLNGKAYAGQTFIENPSEYGVDDEFIDYVRTTRTGVTDLSAFMLQHKKELDSIDLLIPKMEEYHSLLRAIKEENLDIYITSSVNNRIEISSGQAGKHAGLQYILTHFGIDPLEAAAFGNADNDIDMIKHVKYGFAVANATKNCLAAASKIVPSNLEDGVAVGIEEEILNAITDY